MEQFLQSDLIALIKRFGDFGVFIAMFLESSIVPLPSEAIVIGAGAIGLSLTQIVIFGSLGSTAGAMVGYALGRYAAMPVILKFGKFIFIKPHHIQKAEDFAKKYGVMSVLIGRVLPIVPFKVFSIAAGITNIAFVPFVVCTLIGVLPRMLILGLVGATIIKYKRLGLIVFAAIIALFVVYKFFEKNGNLKKFKLWRRKPRLMPAGKQESEKT